MKLYNTMSMQKEEFVPIEPGKVRMYACGPTVYNYIHVGNARPIIMFDVLRRYLEYRGYEVTFVQNFTDVDDKIIKRANEEGISSEEVAKKYIAEYFTDAHALGVREATVHPKATENIQQIIDLITTLIDKGYAYEVNGDVYYRTLKFRDYGKLSHQPIEDLQSGARIDVNDIKENPLDFALWKAAKPGEPFWPSPWGNGRPGWHIECSAMSKPYLPLDIHGGGMDLVFPHHENEIAQTEASCHCQLAKYWMHNAFVQINSEKMSKSLGNFKTIRDILKTWLPEVLRYFLLSKHYRSPIDFTSEGMDDAERALSRVYQSMREAEKALTRAKWKKTALPEDLRKEWDGLEQAFISALDDDLNTAQALGHVFSMTRIVNRLLDDKALRASEGTREILNSYRERLGRVAGITGLFGEDPETFLQKLRARRCENLHIDPKKVEELLAQRLEARRNKDFQRSDEIRAQIAALGVEVRDTPEGQVWDLA